MMGIAYRALLREPEVLAELVEYARGHAELRGWLAAEAPRVELAAAQVGRLDGASERRSGLSLSGLWINAHFGADDLCLVFDGASGELVDPSRADPSAAAVPAVHGFAV